MADLGCQTDAGAPKAAARAPQEEQQKRHAARRASHTQGRGSARVTGNDPACALREYLPSEALGFGVLKRSDDGDVCLTTP